VRDRLGSKPIFRPDKDVLPLKACDIWAWQVGRHLGKDQPQGIEHNDYIDTLSGLHGVGQHSSGFSASVQIGEKRGSIFAKMEPWSCP